jgi:8-oxo-dGTP diphosphatase
MSYKTPKLTVDGIILDDEKVVLVKRGRDPFKGKWALPGGYVEYNEKVEDAMIREIKEETSLNTEIKELIGVYSDPNRDPRGHTITIVFLLKIVDGEIKCGDDACDVKFFNLDQLPELSFDHDKIIADALRRVK